MAARKTERLLNLVMCLLHTRGFLSAEAIRTAVPQYAEAPSDEAFKRMFERDKDELRQLGIPLETGTNSVWDEEPGYRVPRRDYELPDIALEPDEAAAVGLAARAWHGASLSEPAERALQKLRAAGVDTDEELPAGLQPRVEATEPAFGAMLDAVQERRVVTFDYRRGGEAAVATRHLEPWGVVSWHGRWYVVGHDLDRAAVRVFRLGRVVGAVSMQGPAGAVSVPAGVDLVALVADSVRDDGRSGTARLRVRAGHADDLRREAVDTEPGEGWDVLCVPFADLERLADRVVAYGAEIVVVDPPELRAGVVARLRAVVEALA